VVIQNQSVTDSPQSSAEISSLVRSQRSFFASGQTRSIDFRLEKLKLLKSAILQSQAQIVQAVQGDLGRPEFEAYFEIASLAEINLAIKQLKKWSKAKKIASSIEQFPSSAWIEPQPLGIVLIIAPWNYPFQLTISPLIGAIAAGNCAIIKPSEYAPYTSKVIAKMIQDCFDREYVAVVEGGVSVSQNLLAEKFDHIFFTGGSNVGRIVMKASAEHLTPVTLELGGKSPCIVDSESNLEVAAKRITWGKFINAGQTCVAPDYLLVDRKVKAQLLALVQKHITTFYGEDPRTSTNYGRIINQKHLQRLTSFLENGKIICGGQFNLEERYLSPTILDQVNWSDPVMQEEIFGPILPVVEYDDLNEALSWVNQRPKPLALYFFSKNPNKIRQVLDETSSGGVCINDVVMHLGVTGLPFGGVGESGIGSYHGKASFDTFSHYRSILKKAFWLDLDWRYAPYKLSQLKLIKWIVSR